MYISALTMSSDQFIQMKTEHRSTVQIKTLKWAIGQNTHCSIHQPGLKMLPSRRRVLYLFSTLYNNPVHQSRLYFRVVFLFNLFLNFSA